MPLTAKKLDKSVLPELDAKTARQARMLGGAIGGLVVVVLLVYFIIWPTYQRISTMRTAVADGTTTLERLRTKASKLQAAHAAYENIAPAQLAMLDEAIGDYSDLPQALKLLNYLATEIAQAGGPLYITNMSMTPVPDDAPGVADDTVKTLQAQNIDVTVSLVGDYQAIRDYVTAIKALRHNFYLQQLVLSTSDQNADNILQASVMVRYYYYN